MSNEFRLTSLAMVKEEVNLTLEQILSLLEDWFAGFDEGESKEKSIEQLTQLSNICSIINLVGLADLYGAVVNVLKNNDGIQTDTATQNILADILLSTRNYLSYVEQHGDASPELIYPELERLERLAGVAVRPIFRWNTAGIPILTGEYRTDQATIRRLRTMFQVGVLAFIKNDKGQAEILLNRASARLAELSDGSLSHLWTMINELLTAMCSDPSVIVLAKRQLLYFDRFILSGAQGPLKQADFDLAYQAFSWLYSVQQVSSGVIIAVHQKPASFNWASFARSRSLIEGVSLETLQTVGTAIKEELSSLRELLEEMAQNTAQLDKSLLDMLVNQFRKLADIMTLLAQPKLNALISHFNDILLKSSLNGQLSDRELNEIADGLIYLDSCANRFIKEGTQIDLDHFDALAADAHVAEDIVESTVKIVVDEAYNRVQQVKEALDQYANAQFDVSYIQELPIYLSDIYGTFSILGLDRASRIVKLAGNFVHDRLLSKSTIDGIEPALDTFADAIIAIEYYLTQLKYDRNTSDEILKMAESSLAAVGYALV